MSTEAFSGEVFMHSDRSFTLIPALRSHRFYHFVNINIDKYRRRAGYWEVVQDCLNPSEGIHAEMEDERRSGYPGSP